MAITTVNLNNIVTPTSTDTFAGKNISYLRNQISYHSSGLVDPGTAFNKNWGINPGTIPQIGSILGNSKVVYTDASGKLVTSGTTSVQVEYLSNASGDIQSQITARELAFNKNSAFNKDFGNSVGKIPAIASTFSAGQIVFTDAQGKLATSGVTTTPAQFNYLNTSSGDIQTQINTINSTIGLSQTIYISTGNQTSTSSTAANINDLVFNATVANKSYQIDGIIHIGCNNTGGVKLAISIPSGATLFVGLMGNNVPNSSNAAQNTLSASATLQTTPYCQSNSTLGWVRISGEVILGATTGNIQFMFAPGTDSQTATVFQQGTWINIVQYH